MKVFEWSSPTTIEDAIAQLSVGLNADDSQNDPYESPRPLAGGQDLLTTMKEYLVRPPRVVNLKTIQGLDGIDGDAKTGLKIGALVKLIDVIQHPEITANFPGLAEAAHSIATPQIRNMATVGGNLCQRPRCWYFRNGLGLLPKDENGKELVAAGENRYHAILGNQGPAKFVSPSTLVPILIAYGATIRLDGPKGKRELPLEKFFVIPKTESEREHDLRPNEIVTEVLIPPASDVKAAHYEIRQKEAFDWPLAVTAVALKM